MSRMHLALYRGPATDWRHKLAHRAICWWTCSEYSHCELVINGICYTASSRDGGVRSKAIDLTSGKWDVIEIDGDPDRALAFFKATAGLPYDWIGVFRFVLPFLPQRRNVWFCSAWCAAALGLPHAGEFDPAELAEYLTT